MPEEGYAATELSLNNTGEDPVTVSLEEFDFEHLCLQGFSSVPANLNEIPAGGAYVLVVGVCDYIEEQGERDSLVSAEIIVEHTGESSPLSIGWSFTPKLNIGSDDSGM